MLFGQRITQSQEILFNYGPEHNGETHLMLIMFMKEKAKERYGGGKGAVFIEHKPCHDHVLSTLCPLSPS